jgi:hypothetical protein
MGVAPICPPNEPVAFQEWFGWELDENVVRNLPPRRSIGQLPMVDPRSYPAGQEHWPAEK